MTAGNAQKNRRLPQEPPTSGPLVSVESLLQSADVRNQIADLGIGQLAFVGWHLAFAVSDSGRQVGIGDALDSSAAHILQPHRLAHGCGAATVGAVTHSALGFESILALRLGRS